MNIFFDVDSTILGDDGSLRPHTREVFEELIREGHDVYIWSGVGIRTAEVEAKGLSDLVSGIYKKPRTDFEGSLVRFGIPVMPHFVVDDYPQIVAYFGGHQIFPYYDVRYRDTEMLRIPPMVAQIREQFDAEDIEATGTDD